MSRLRHLFARLPFMRRRKRQEGMTLADMMIRVMYNEDGTRK